MNNITFKNDSADSNVEDAGRSSLESRAVTLRKYMEYGTDEESLIQSAFPCSEEVKEFFENHGSFHDYGLSIDFMMPSEDDLEGYMCYQLSCGGPTEEIRFYYSPEATKPYRVEFVYLNWNCGIGFDVTGEDWVDWLVEFWNDCDTLQSCIDKAS